MKHFAAGQKAILADTYDATAATAAANEIRRLIGITFARATLKYSSTMKNVDDDTYSGTYHAEGFCAANSRNTLHFDAIEGRGTSVFDSFLPKSVRKISVMDPS